jgi:glycosyltransferase 2 family protein
MRAAGGSNRWVQLFGLGLSVLAVVILLGAVDVGETASVLVTADPRFIVLAATLVVVQLLVVTARWWLLLAGISGGPVPYQRLVGPVLIGYLGNFALPSRLGEVVRAILVSRREHRPMTEVFGSVVLERLIDASVLAWVALITAAVLDAPAWIFNVAAIAAIVAAVALVILATPAAQALARRLGRARAGMLRTFGAAIGGFVYGARVRDRARAVALAVVLSAVSWLIEGTVYWLAARSLGLEVSLAVAFLVAAVTVLATAVPSAPAYVGTFELAVTAVATAFGVPAPDALAWALLAHAVTVAPLAIGGIIALLVSGLRASDVIHDAEQAEISMDAGLGRQES